MGRGRGRVGLLTTPVALARHTSSRTPTSKPTPQSIYWLSAGSCLVAPATTLLACLLAQLRRGARPRFWNLPFPPIRAGLNGASDQVGYVRSSAWGAHERLHEADLPLVNLSMHVRVRWQKHAYLRSGSRAGAG